MSGPVLFATLPGHSITKPCDACKEPITLRCTPNGNWIAFDVDPVVLQVMQEGPSLIRGGRVLEMLDAAERHQCRKDG